MDIERQHILRKNPIGLEPDENALNQTIVYNVDDVERLLVEAFIGLMPIGLRGGVSIKRMAELLTSAQIQALAAQGCSQQEIMAESGFSAKTVRAWLRSEHTPNGDIVTRFIGRWSADSEFPDTLSLNPSDYPSWLHLCEKHSGGEMTAAALMSSMQKKNIVTVTDNTITLSKRDNLAIATPDAVDAARRALRFMLSTLGHNLSVREGKYYERQILSEYIALQDIPELKNKLAQIAENAREKAREAIKAYEYEAGKAEEVKHACGLGLYWFEDADL